MGLQFSIKVYKQYFNFACSHFMLFEDGSREPLHGHNYRVSVEGKTPELTEDMVFDFLDIKPIVREVCDRLDHKLIIPKESLHLEIFQEKNNIVIHTKDGSIFSIPQTDVLLLPINNSSAERIAVYLNQEIRNLIWERYQFKFNSLEVEVEETPGQAAVYTHHE